MSGAESKLIRHAVSAHSIICTCRIDQIRHTRLCRRIGPPPIVERLSSNNHRAILIGSAESPSSVIGVAVVWPKNRDGQSSVENGRSGNFPASEHGIHDSVSVASVLFTAAEGNIVYADEVQAVANVHGGRTVVGIGVVTILHRKPVKAGVSYRIFARRIGQRFRIAVVERVFKTMVCSLAQRYLAG